MRLLFVCSCLLTIFYSSKTCYNIFYSDYYSNKAVVEKLINRVDDSLESKEELFNILHILKSSILNKEKIPDTECDNITNLLNILISKF